MTHRPMRSPVPVLTVSTVSTVSDGLTGCPGGPLSLSRASGTMTTASLRDRHASVTEPG